MKDLFEVVKSGNLHEVKVMVFANPSIIFMKNREGKTPWEIADEAHDLKMAAFLKATETRLKGSGLQKIVPGLGRADYPEIIFIGRVMDHCQMAIKYLLLIAVFTALFYFTWKSLGIKLQISMDMKKEQASDGSSGNVQMESSSEKVPDLASLATQSSVDPSPEKLHAESLEAFFMRVFRQDALKRIQKNFPFLKIIPGS